MSIKDVCSQGRGDCPVRTFCDQGGFFRYGRPHFLEQKNIGFFEIMVCPYGQGEFEPLRTKGINFSRFCADVLYGWSLIGIRDCNHKLVPYITILVHVAGYFYLSFHKIWNNFRCFEMSLRKLKKEVLCFSR